MKTIRRPQGEKRPESFLENKSPRAVNRSVGLLTSLVYFVQGALGISAVAFPLFLRQKGWGISEIATFSFIAGFPWTLKLIYGAVSDGLPIGGFHRKPYIILASLGSFLSWLGLSFAGEKTEWLYGFVLLGNLGFAITDVVTDALIVENSTEASAQFYQSLAWGWRSLGAVLGGFGGGWLAQNVPYRLIFLATASLPLATLVLGFMIEEEPRRRGGGERPAILRPVFESLKALWESDLKYFCLLMLTGSFSSAYGTPFFFFMKERLLFSETFIGTLSSLTWLGAILGCVLYGRLLGGKSLKNALFLSLGLNFINSLSTYGVQNSWTASILFSLGGILGYLGLLPLMAAAAFLSRRSGVEGSLFALLMSVFNLGQILAGFIGGRLFDIIGLQALIFLSALVGLSGFLFIRPLKLNTTL